MKTLNRITEIGGEVPTNGASHSIEIQQPYRVQVTIKGISDLLFHRWNCEAVDAKAKAKKGSEEKKSDNIESYVYRNEDNELCIPGEYLRQAVIHAAKFIQDPRSPRKSCMDLMKAALVSLTTLAPLGTDKWDYEDRRRVVIQRNGITRVRPAMKTGWTTTFIFMVNLPEYITPQILNDVIQSSGKLIGIGDFRPTYGRFNVVEFSELGD